MSESTRRARRVPQAAPVTLAELRESREVLACAPSGYRYLIRPLNLERHALAGGLPSRLRQVALRGLDAVNDLFGSGDEDELSERGLEIRDYLDEIVRQLVVEPDLTGVDLDVLPPPDYRWLVAVAMGELDTDAEGARLFGRESIARFRGAARKPGAGGADRRGSDGAGAAVPDRERLPAGAVAGE